MNPRYHNQMFSLIHPGLIEKAAEEDMDHLPQYKKVIQYCGMEDSVVNHINLLKLVNEGEVTSDAIERLADE